MSKIDLICNYLLGWSKKSLYL